MPPPPTALNNSTRGILTLCLGVAVFSMQDLVIKLISGEYPVHQALVLRSLTAFPVLFAIVAYEGGLRTLITSGWRVLLVRGLIMFTAYTSYYLGLAALPMATCVSLYFTAPLFITLLSVFFLGETVDAPRWIALIAGFVGVLIVVKPGTAGFDWGMLLPIYAGFSYGLSMVMARWLGGRESASVMATYGNVVFLAGALALAAVFASGAHANEAHKSLAFLMRGWAMPTTRDTLLMMSCGIVAGLGLVLLTQAYRVAEASVVAPFEYTGLIWSVLLGFLVWNEWPDAVSWFGIAIIIAAGLFILHREREVKRRRAAQAA
ncbi:MAG: DMT family transporter [Hyphomicrobiales bacterium]